MITTTTKVNPQQMLAYKVNPLTSHKKLIQGMSKCTQQVRGYQPTPTTTNNNHTPPTTIGTNNHQTATLKLITWNTMHISSSLPDIQ